MKLKTYLAEHRLTAEKFAESIGFSTFAVRKWVSGERIPQIEPMNRIRAATGGAVQPNDFYPLNDSTVPETTACVE